MPEDKDFYKAIIDNLYDGVYFVDRKRRITYWNKGAERISGYHSEQVIGRFCQDNLLNHVTANGVQLCQGQCPLAACMGDGKTREVDIFLHHADGHRVPVLVRAAPLRDDNGEIIGAVETFTGDIGAMAVRRELRELRRTVQTDKLTEISSRLFIERRIQAAVRELEYSTETTVGILYMDIDHFKQCNDTYGHDIGDKVLRMVASTLQHNLRQSDVVGRWGGEEFLAVLYDIESVRALKSIAEKLRVLVECSHLDLPETSLAVTISVGATLLQPSDTIESVIRRADELLYKSKRNGRNQVSIG
jgi:diguanylate cyclase (GGDEF)-like protein/PAS domain S-box-containing protein